MDPAPRVSSSSGNSSIARYVPLTAVTLVGLSLSLYLFHAAGVKEEALVRGEFERRAFRTVTVLQEGILRQMEPLASIAGLYAASRAVERSEFRAFARAALSRHPEIQALEWIPRVRRAERGLYEEDARAEGFHRFSITERKGPGTVIRAGERAEYFPAYFLEPMPGDQEAMGYDVASDPVRRVALERARDSGEMIATSPLLLVQDRGAEAGLVVFQPIYRNDAPHGTLAERRKNLAGFGLGVFRVRNMLDPLIREMGVGGIEVQIHDRMAPSGSRLLYVYREDPDHGQESPDEREIARIRSGDHMDAEVEIPGRRWSVLLFPSAAFRKSQAGFHRWGVLGGGLLVTGLLVALQFVWVRRSERIERLAAKIAETNEDLQREIAERERAERRIGEALELNRAVIEASPLGICTYGSDGLCRSANEAAARILGAEREDLLRQDLFRIEPLRPAGVPEMARRILEGDPGGELELHTVSTFGREVWLGLRLAPFVSGGSRGILLMIEDRTARKHAEEALWQSEERLRQSQKMEAVGRLAGGIAHDFNNLLLVINGYASLLLAHLRDEDPRRKEAEEILAAGDRAAGLTRQLLAFGRRQVLQPKVIDLNALFSAMAGMLRRLIGEHIDLVTRFSDGLWPVKADPGQLEQILANLAVNSRDAMPGGGRLTIRTRNIDPDERLMRDHPSFVPGGHVLIEVSDTGTGMDEETRSHIFEPFYTTKETGKGTGLGMATVYGIVNQSRGHIEVDSEIGRGTTVRIYFPRAEEAQEGQDPEKAVQPAPPGRETVLLVEDEPAVRSLVREILSGRGYRVLEAKDGEEAFSRIEECGEPIDLLISDVVMPRMGGPELWERLSSKRSGMRALFISGYARDALDDRRLTGSGCGFLQKPFSPEMLAAKVRELLDSATGSSR